MPTDKITPRRRFYLDLKLGADDRETLVSELREITRQISLAHLNGDCVMGGYSAGYALNLTEDPTMTHDRYMAAIDQDGGATSVPLRDANDQ